MEESEDNMNVDKIKVENVHADKDKPRKRSLVERELETTLTARVTAPLANTENASTSRYGRARRIKTSIDFCDTEKSVANYLKSTKNEVLTIDSQPTSPVYKMQASNSLIHESSPKKTVEVLDTQIEQIYKSNISLSRFGSNEKIVQGQSPAKKFPVHYVRKDIIQSREKEKDSPVNVINNIISSGKSENKSNSHLKNILERSSEKYNLNGKSQNGYLDNSSVVKTLDFDCNKKKKKESKDVKSTISKSDLFEMEAKCEYQMGDLAWARMGTFPFWPCIVTREPGSDMFVRKKLFGKIERDVIHVTFFGDNGRRSWVLDSMLRKFQGLPEFEAARDQFTPEAKKKDPKLYAAFFISDKKLAPWYTAIEEADILQREPKRLRIDLLNEMFGQTKLKHTPLKVQKSSKVTRTNSDVSLSESLFDSLFSENDGKLLEVGHKKNKSLDVSEVVTACLDNMAAKTGMTMIQKQSHMDIWLQKAKSKTPEKLNISVTVERLDDDRKSKSTNERDTKSKERDNNSKKKKKSLPPRETPIKKPYSFRKSTESRNLLSYHNEHDYSKNIDSLDKTNNTDEPILQHDSLNEVVQCDNGICVIEKIESLCPTQDKNGDVLSEIQEELITDVDYSHEKMTEITNSSGVVITELVPMDVDSYESEHIEKTTEKSQESIEDNSTEQSKKTISEQPNHSETSIGDSKDKDHYMTQTSPNDTSMDDLRCCANNEVISLDVSADEKNKSRVQDKTGNQIPVKRSKRINNKMLKETPIDLENNGPEKRVNIDLQSDSRFKDESIDNEFTNSKNFNENSKTKVSLRNEFEPDINKINSLTCKSLQDMDNRVEFNSSQNEKKNANEVPVKSMNKDETAVSLINKDQPTNETHTHTSSSQTDIKQPNTQNNFEKVPIVKLTVIKEASVNNLNNVQKNIDLPAPKRRSSRVPIVKTDKKEYKPMEEPDFLMYLEMTKDSVIEEHPDLSENDIVDYLYKTWQFRLRKSNSPHAVEVEEHGENDDVSKTVAASDKKKSHRSLTLNKKNKTKDDVKASQSKLEHFVKFNKRSLRLNKSQSPTRVNNVFSEDIEITLSKSLTENKNADSDVKKESVDTQSKIYIQDSYKVISHSDVITENRIQDDLIVIKDILADEVAKSDSETILSNKHGSQIPINDELAERSKITKSGRESLGSTAGEILQQNKSTGVEEIKVDQLKIGTQMVSQSNSSNNHSELGKSNSHQSLMNKSVNVELVTDKSETQVNPVQSQETLSQSSLKKTDCEKHDDTLKKRPTPHEKAPLKNKRTQKTIEKEFAHIDSVLYGNLQSKQNNIDLEKEITVWQLHKPQSKSSPINKSVNEQKVEKSNTEKKSGFSKPNLESKRSLRLLKSQTPSVSKKTENVHRDSTSRLLEVNQESIENDFAHIDDILQENIQISENDADLKTKIAVLNNAACIKDGLVVNSDKIGFHLSKAMLEPKVVIERKKGICDVKNIKAPSVNIDKLLISKDTETNSGVESETDKQSFDTSSKKNKEVTQEINVELSDKYESKAEKGLQDIIPKVNGVLSESEAESVVIDPKRRMDVQSCSKSGGQKRDNDEGSHSNMTDINPINKSQTCSVGEIKSDITSQNESSEVQNVPVEDTNPKSNCIATEDNVSLSSDLSNGLIDRSSDKDFDPETVSLSSMTSETSSASDVIKPKTISGKNNALQKMFESDNESISSLDDMTLSELKIKSTKETTEDLKCNLENSMDSIISGASGKRLRLVLNDCILDAKDNSKLPEIQNVRSIADEEFEISESNTEIKTCKKPGLSRIKTPVETKHNGFDHSKSTSPVQNKVIKVETPVPEYDTVSIKSSGSDASTRRRGRNKPEYKPMEEPEFLQYLELKQDALLDEHPEVTPSEAAIYLYKTWQYEESLKSDIRKNEEVETSNLVKGSSQVVQEPPKRKKAPKQKKLINIDKVIKKSPKNELTNIMNGIEHRELPKRKASKALYKEDFSDIEDEIQMFEIFNKKKGTVHNATPTSTVASESAKVKSEADNKETTTVGAEGVVAKKEENVDLSLDSGEEEVEYYDQEEIYFEQLTNPKPNVFKGLLREKVCEICEKTANLVKCKGCSGMFHLECVNKEDEFDDTPAPTRGRKKKKKLNRGRKPKSSLDSNEESHSDEKPQDLNLSEENMSLDDTKDLIPLVIPDAVDFENQMEEKMKAMIETVDKIEYDSYSSDDGIDWENAIAGKCEIVDIKPKKRPQCVNTDDFKCKNCQKDDTPICFVCKSPVSPRDNVERRQKCQVAHCHKYYHLECLEHWPQTQFNAGVPSKTNKKIDEQFEAMTCPRHVCHTCVCDDPRGCKTRFSGDKLARCVRCPATYHSFTKCLPAGSQILSASHIVCPRHYEHRPGKVPYHVNTGWCFICALGGNLICCDYCPTSFHADCLNIEPPEGGYMCEDCETGRLPLYGEMVWVKLGHYRWWPGIVLHPSEIPENILAVKHSPGEFVVRFFGQYDHYWVNRGRVFPFQEGDSGRISTQKSKIDEAFTIAMEHAKRAFEILKNVEPNDEEDQDIQSSLLPPHYVKLKVNKPCGALYGKKVDIEESSLTQCECNPDVEDPCGPYSHCLNRMLLTECGPICRSGERCQNRAFEKRQYPKLVPYRTSHRGWGLKTLEPIKAGQFVIEYVGELIDEAEFRRRMQRKHETRDENFYFLTLDKERLIDAGPKGNLARFMNHCCEPNCETQKWTVLGDVRVGLFALRDIPANTEVTFNYNLECTGIEKKQCMCGAKRCAGYIGAKPKQDEPQPKKIKVAAKRTYKKRKNTIESSPSTMNKPKRPVGRPAKPRELTEIEKDLLIIKNATNGLSSDSEGSVRLSSVDEKNTAKALKRKRVSFSSEDTVVLNGCSSPRVKKIKLDDDIEKSSEVGD